MRNVGLKRFSFTQLAMKLYVSMRFKSNEVPDHGLYSVHISTHSLRFILILFSHVSICLVHNLVSKGLSTQNTVDICRFKHKWCSAEWCRVNPLLLHWVGRNVGWIPVEKPDSFNIFIVIIHFLHNNAWRVYRNSPQPAPVKSQPTQYLPSANHIFTSHGGRTAVCLCTSKL